MRALHLLALALIAFQAGAAGATTLHLWRFEDTPGFFADSVGGATLAGGASQATLPGSGRGSEFVGLPGPPNASAADTVGNLDLNGTLAAPLSGDFTTELLVHFDTLSGTFGSHLVGPAATGVSSGVSWSLQARYDGAGGAAPGELILALVEFGSLTTEVVLSGIVPETGKDYYIATSFDLAGGQVTFYVQNLTDGGPLQTVSATHSRTLLNPITAFGIGGFTINNLLATDGLIDEVRISDEVLPAEELYINSPIPEPGTAALLAIGLGLLGAQRRRR